MLIEQMKSESSIVKERLFCAFYGSIFFLEKRGQYKQLKELVVVLFEYVISTIVHIILNLRSSQ